MDLALNGKRALVCGASQGLGAATARALAAEGVQIILLARNKSRLEETIKTLKGSHHTFYSLDINDHQALKTILELELKKAPIDILINNSGGPKGGPVEIASHEEFKQAFHQHLLTSSFLAQLLIPAMKKQNFGRILNIISTSVKSPIMGLGVSNTIRAAMASWSKTLSFEVAEFGITVNNLLPGYTKTQRLIDLILVRAKEKNIPYLDEEKIWLSEVPAKRFGNPEDLAALTTFLASPLAGYINGTSIPIDGGKTPVI